MTVTAVDHVFAWCQPSEAAPGGRLAAVLADAGLVPSYRRRHVGQGTANVCYCFDNLYLELLFVVDRRELGEGPAEAIGLAARASAATTGGSPFGVALRGPLPGASRPYRFDGLPPGLVIPVSAACRDPLLPFVFGSPGQSPPAAWTDGRAGARQTAAGLGAVSAVTLCLPADPAPLHALGLDARRDDRHALALAVDRAGGGRPLVIEFATAGATGSGPLVVTLR